MNRSRDRAVLFFLSFLLCSAAAALLLSGCVSRAPSFPQPGYPFSAAVSLEFPGSGEPFAAVLTMESAESGRLVFASPRTIAGCEIVCLPGDGESGENGKTGKTEYHFVRGGLSLPLTAPDGCFGAQDLFTLIAGAAQKAEYCSDTELNGERASLFRASDGSFSAAVPRGGGADSAVFLVNVPAGNVKIVLRPAEEPAPAVSARRTEANSLNAVKNE